MFDLSVVQTAFAATGSGFDAMGPRFITLCLSLGVLSASSATIMKGASIWHDQGRFSSEDLAKMGKGAVLIGGATTGVPWLVGAGMGATGTPGGTSLIGDILGAVLNPVGPFPVAALYLYYRMRRHEKSLDI